MGKDLANARTINPGPNSSKEFIQYSEVVSNPIVFASNVEYSPELSNPPGGQICVLGRGGWWSCGARCAAGTAGCAVLGDIAGCGGDGLPGAAVGTLVPGVGTAVGTVTGSAAIGIAGTIGGGLEGSEKYRE